ncbi:MAG: 4-(cytidine 5'-diphospho)-2-C-methyl-D-erythritol kinase [Clostridia bacterium]|nr:4-(cytidine 5'-diphospho)-2-C-methyl-D-erythritol kinase [Clostridia bacterium]
MKKICLKARAKINLNLDVTGKREDGYHIVEMVMQQIDLYDVVTLRTIDSGIEIQTTCEYIKDDDSNIAYKAAEALMKDFPKVSGVNIHIEKFIPVAAGMAGGSSDAAAVLVGMNRLFELGLSREELMVYGVKIGADVPFCIMGGAAIAEGIGEELTPIGGLKEQWVLIAKPPISVSTKEIYTNYSTASIRAERPFAALIKAIEDQDMTALSTLMFNSLEEVTFSKYKMVEKLKRKVQETGATAAMMSGSGPTVFGLYKSYDKGYKALKHIKKLYPQTYLVKTYNKRMMEETNHE